MSRTNPPRTLAMSCLDRDCPCELYVPAQGNSAILDPDLIRGFMDLRRAYLSLEKKMKERGLELK